MQDYSVMGLIQSPIQGPKGNIEFLVYLRNDGEESGDIIKLVNDLIPEIE
jgi:hypothetical protein